MYKNDIQVLDELKRVYEKIFKEPISYDILCEIEKTIIEYILIWKTRNQKYKLDNFLKRFRRELLSLYGYRNLKEINSYVNNVIKIINKAEKGEEKFGIYSCF